MADRLDEGEIPIGKGEHGIIKSRDLPWSVNKCILFMTLKRIGCTSPLSSLSAIEIAEESGLTPKQVRHYCYHAMVSGHIGICTTMEDVRGYTFYLTIPGARIDPEKAYAEQILKKKRKKVIVKN